MPSARPYLLRLALALVATAIPLVVFEVLLATRAVPLSEAAARYVHGCYEPSQPDRYIHATIKPLKLKIHRPDFESDCYFLGYRWTHRADGHGWRNPETLDSADVVVLGDSIVYGHGVEENQTIAHFLRGLLDRRVVNMGITGGSPVYYLGYLRNFALPLSPSVVAVFFFGNDLKDVGKKRSPEQLERFIQSGKGREAQVLPRSTLFERLRFHSRREPSWLDRLALVRLVDYQLRAWRAGGLGAVEPVRGRDLPTEGGKLDLKPPSDEVLDAMEKQLTVAYVRRALWMMAQSSHESGAALVVGHVGRRSPTDWLLRGVLREASEEHGFHYFDTPVLEGPYRLRNDGHLSEAGHRHLAETLKAYLSDKNLLQPSSN